MGERTSPASGGAAKPKPFLFPEYCKGCGRCIASCPKDCIAFGPEVDPRTGLVPVVIDLEICNGCGLCIEACPEPYGLHLPPRPAGDELVDPAELFGPRPRRTEVAVDLPDEMLPLPPAEPLAVKGTYASAIGALVAGCRTFYGYPITPSTEGAEMMARVLPGLGGTFFQAVSEVAAINHLYGAGAAGVRAMTFTSSPGFSLMLEGISYMIGAELPGVIVDVMRGGPGLGNIAPEQSDIKLACRGLGHGNTHGIVLAASSPQEMLDLTLAAFELAFRYRNPVVLLADGYVGQTTGKVTLPPYFVRPGLPAWAVWGDRAHRGNLVSSIQLAEADLERHNLHLEEKYAAIRDREQRSERYRCDDADVVLVACNTPARLARAAVDSLRAEGIAAGLFRPITLWPFPIRAFAPLAARAERVIVVEASPGQLEDELRLALTHAELRTRAPLESVRRFGGVLPSTGEIVRRVLESEEVPS